MDSGTQPTLQCSMLLWLDENCDVSQDRYRADLRLLQELINDVHAFNSIDACVDFMTDTEEQRLFLIVSHACAETIIRHIHPVAHLHRIYITGNESLHPITWIDVWPKVRGVYGTIQSLCESLSATLKYWNHDSIAFSTLSTDDVTNINLDQLEPSFMYTQLLKDILMKMKYSEQSRHHFVDHCRATLPPSARTRAIIDEFEHEYSPETAVWWYTRPCFLYEMLNQSLRFLQLDMIITMGFFFVDLHRQIELLDVRKTYRHTEQSITVYRGQSLSTSDFRQLNNAKGGMISFNSFLSTSKSIDIPLAIVQSASAVENTYGILFVIIVDPTVIDVPFANISSQSALPDEEEVLFSMHAIFRIGTITKESDGSRSYTVSLISTTNDDQPQRLLKEATERELLPDDPYISLVALTMQLNQTKSIPALHKTLQHAFIHPLTQAEISWGLGVAEYVEGKYERSLHFLKQAVKNLERGRHEYSILQLI